MRLRHDFFVTGYVVMPEHVHLLVSEPRKALLAKALQALKLSVAVKSAERPFWQARYYDFNVFTAEKSVEKLNYMHGNLVTRGLVGFAENWRWSSARHWLTGEVGVAEVESTWTAARRNRAATQTQVSDARPGAPNLVARCDVGHPAGTEPEASCCQYASPESVGSSYSAATDRSKSAGSDPRRPNHNARRFRM